MIGYCLRAISTRLQPIRNPCPKKCPEKKVHFQYLIFQLYCRLFTRTLPIPFEKKTSRLSIKEGINSHSTLESLLVEVPKSISVIIKLHGDFKNMMTDVLFDKIHDFMTTSKLDVRSELNLAALLYATGKVCMYGCIHQKAANHSLPKRYN